MSTSKMARLAVFPLWRPARIESWARLEKPFMTQMDEIESETIHTIGVSQDIATVFIYVRKPPRKLS